MQIRKCPIQPRQYSFSPSKQARSECPQERDVSSRIWALNLALVLVDSLTLTYALDQNPIVLRGVHVLNPFEKTVLCNRANLERPFCGKTSALWNIQLL